MNVKLGSLTPCRQHLKGVLKRSLPMMMQGGDVISPSQHKATSIYVRAMIAYKIL